MKRIFIILATLTVLNLCVNVVGGEPISETSPEADDFEPQVDNAQENKKIVSTGNETTDIVNIGAAAAQESTRQAGERTKQADEEAAAIRRMMLENALRDTAAHRLRKKEATEALINAVADNSRKMTKLKNAQIAAAQGSQEDTAALGKKKHEDAQFLKKKTRELKADRQSLKASLLRVGAMIEKEKNQVEKDVKHTKKSTFQGPRRSRSFLHPQF